ncbi:MAG TPA: hypothetical protein VKB47_07575 [Terracidiphilus sp.]|nr:hypothetical protein [Terracidiphilus sp.]
MAPEQYLEIIGILVQAVVIGQILYRRIYKKFPLFTLYLVWVLLFTSASLFIVSLSAASRAYLVADIIDAAFMLSVLVELSMSVLNPIRSSLPRWTVLVVGGLLALAFGVIWPFAIPPGLKILSSVSQQIIHIDITSSALWIIFFLALAALSQLLSIGWRDRELQIATALGFYSLVGLSVTLLHMNQGIGNEFLNRQYHMLDELVAGSYICSMVYLIVSFAQKVPERREFTPQMQSFLLAVAGSARATRMAMANSSETTSGRGTRD